MKKSDLGIFDVGRLKAKEFELNHEDIERILASYARNYFSEKEYILEYTERKDGVLYPDTVFRASKVINPGGYGKDS